MDKSVAAFTPVVENSNDWQRISPIALLFFTERLIKFFVGNLVAFLPALYFGYDGLKENPQLGLAIIVGILLFICLTTFLNYYFFQYRLTQDHIEIRSGVLSKKHINLPFSKIQNVKLEQPIYYRPFNYTCLQLDTAGSAKQEAQIVALKVDFAEQLKKEILAQHSKTHHAESPDDSAELTSDAVENEIILNTRSITDLVIHGITNNRIWIFLGGLAPFFDNIASYIVSTFSDFGINIEQLLTFADKPMWQITLYAVTLTFLILLPFIFFSIAGAVITFYHYTLSKVGDRYIRRSGLLTKYEVSMRLSRLQMVIRQQDWLDLLLKRINLKFEQANNVLTQHQAGAQNNRIIVPSIFAYQCAALVDDVYPNNQMMTIDYQRISKRFLLRNLVFILLPLYSLVAVFLTVTGKTQLLWGITPLAIFAALLIFMRWYRWGYASDDNFIYIRRGFFGVDYLCFEHYKVQQVKFKQSWFQQRHQLCSISVVLAAGAINLPFIKADKGSAMLDEVLYQVESSGKSWM